MSLIGCNFRSWLLSIATCQAYQLLIRNIIVSEVVCPTVSIFLRDQDPRVMLRCLECELGSYCLFFVLHG